MATDAVASEAAAIATMVNFLNILSPLLCPDISDWQNGLEGVEICLDVTKTERPLKFRRPQPKIVFTMAPALAMSICPEWRAFNSAITLPMSLIPLAPIWLTIA